MTQENKKVSSIMEACAYYLTKKSRFCRFQPSKGQKYCPEHACIMGVQLARKRIPCPISPMHSCYEDSLEKHLKKCNFKKKSEVLFFQEGINSGGNDGEVIPEPKATVHNTPKEEILKLIDKVSQLYNEHIGKIESEILTHDCLNEELINTAYGIQAFRHRKQQASLIGLMEKRNLLGDGHNYVELGAGKGQLSHWVHKAVASCNDVSFTLIDRSSVRYKYDSIHKYDESSSKFERIRIDLEHLNLGLVPGLVNGHRQLVAMGKHLCGAATDLALRCLMETLHTKGGESDEETPPEKRLKMESETDVQKRLPAGMVIALCCHHRCTWPAYVGKPFLRRCGLTARDFQLLTSISGWATCAWRGWRDTPGAMGGGKQNPVELSDQQDEEHLDVEMDSSSLHIQSTLQMDQAERERVGRLCKRLLDWGRVEYLQQYGLQSCLREYIEDTLTPENIVLIGEAVK